MKNKTIEVDLLKRLITNLWYQDPGIDDVNELSKDLIDAFPELFVDIMEDDEYKGTRPEWLQNENGVNNIYAPGEEE